MRQEYSYAPCHPENELIRATPSHETAADGVLLRPLTAADLPAAHTLSLEARWPHRLVDWEFALSLGEGLAAERDGTLVGTAMRWRWGEHHSTVGLLIVAEHCRGRRIGERLMLGLLSGLDGAVVLYATPQGRGLYERLGFTAIGEVRQHQGRAMQAPLVALAPGVRLRPASRSDTESLIALDAGACGMPREALIRRLLDIGEAVVLDRDGQAEGFAVLRRFGRGHAIGPVIAPNVAGAKALISHWVNLRAGKFVRIDVDFAGGLAAWLETLGLARAGGPATMVRGDSPQRSTDIRQFALVSQAMG